MTPGKEDTPRKKDIFQPLPLYFSFLALYQLRQGGSLIFFLFGVSFGFGQKEGQEGQGGQGGHWIYFNPHRYTFLSWRVTVQHP